MSKVVQNNTDVEVRLESGFTLRFSGEVTHIGRQLEDDTNLVVDEWGYEVVTLKIRRLVDVADSLKSL